MKILVLGASGFLGQKLFRVLNKSCNEVTGTYYEHPLPDLLPLNVTDKESVTSLFYAKKPELVIHSAGIGRPDDCETKPELADEINVDGTRNIVEACRLNNSILVYPSSTFVFSGKESSSYKEEDKCEPINKYGETKTAAEKLVSELSAYIILRTDMLYGYNGKEMPNGFFGAIMEKQLKLNARDLRQPLLADDLVKVIELLVQKRKSGIFHVAGEPITQYDLGQKLEKLIRSTSSILRLEDVGQELSQGTPRPKGVLLDTAKIATFGFIPTSIESSLWTIGEQFRKATLEGSKWHTIEGK